jgi:hypothetical protein
LAELVTVLREKARVSGNPGFAAQLRLALAAQERWRLAQRPVESEDARVARLVETRDWADFRQMLWEWLEARGLGDEFWQFLHSTLDIEEEANA